jgi:hypothetical protein
MASKYSALPERRQNQLARFWELAFVNAPIPHALKRGSAAKPEGLAHIAAEYADAAVAERRRRNFRERGHE